MRIVREIQAGRGIGGAAVHIDPERTDFPVGRNGANQDEQREKATKEQEESEPSAAAPFRFLRARGRQSHLGPTLPRGNYGLSFARGCASVEL